MERDRLAREDYQTRKKSLEQLKDDIFIMDIIREYIGNDAPTKLQAMRKRLGFTQEELASASGVPVSTIRAYERRAKDLNKAQVDIVIRLADALECEITDVVW